MDLKELELQFNKVLSYSQDIDIEKLNTSEIISKWANAKEKYIDLFGGNLIYECPKTIVFNLSPEERKERLKQFCHYIAITYSNDNLIDFIQDQEDSFFENKVSTTYHHNGKVIFKGSKLIKAFKYFEKNPLILDDIQTQASMLIQETKIEGTLCISVHPLDYLSLSENTYSWRSCHNLRGEYRSGNLSYMLDNVTCVCYLRGANDIKLPNFPEDVPWNSKKWRMLLFLGDMDQEMVYAGRQYPFFNREALNLIKEHFLDYFFPETNGFKWLKDWRNDNIKSVQGIDLIENHIVIDHKMYPAGTIIKDAKKSRHFNDLISSSLYKPYYIYKRMVYWDAPIWYDREIGYAPVITIGAEAPCVCCGKHLNLDESTFLCDDCFKNIGDNSNVHHLVRCDYCGSFFDSEEEGGYDEVTSRYYCGECADEVIMCDYCEGLYEPDQIYCDDLGCLCENCRKDRRYD